MSPFEAIYGRSPPSLRSYIAVSTSVASLDESLSHRRQLIRILKENLALAQLRMRTRADNHRQDKVFQIDDWVWLRLRPYRQLTMHGRSSPKLAKRFFGPFQITKRIGAVAYELALPENAKIHPVFHISKLKPFFGNPPTQIPCLEPSVTGTLVELQPSSILETRWVRTQRGMRKQLLVQWEGFPAIEATWEDEAQFLEVYPNYNLEDKVVSEGQGIDTRRDAVAVPTNAHGLTDAGPSNKDRSKRNKKSPRWLEGFVT